MKLHPPFIISSALAPGLKIGEGATLSLLAIEPDDDAGPLGRRHRARFELYTPDFSYVDTELRSGQGGFCSLVEAFETFLAFLEAAGESFNYQQRTGRPGNVDLFPPYVVAWAAEHGDDLACARMDITDPDSGESLHHLIEED